MSVTTSGGALGLTRGEGDEDSSRLASQRYAPNPASPPTRISTTNVETTRRRIRLELVSASSHELPGGKSAKLLGSVSIGLARHSVTVSQPEVMRFDHARAHPRVHAVAGTQCGKLSITTTEHAFT